MPKENAKVDEGTQATDDKAASPGQVGEDGKYTDEGLAALVDQIAKGDKADDKADPAPAKEAKKPDTTDDADDKGEKMVPISRLNAVIDERNRLRDQVGKVVQQTPQDKLPTVDELRAQHKTKRKEWQKAVFENEPEKADSLLDEMDALEAAIDDARFDEVNSTTRAQSADDIRYDNLLEKYMEQYPMINKQSKDFDQSIVTEMFEVREAFIAKGLPWSQALEKAHNLVLKPLAASKKVKDTSDTRTSESKKNLADALTRQPANVSDLGSAADSINNNKFGIDINRLTMEQFDKLPDDIKSKLRGDTLEEHHLGNRQGGCTPLSFALQSSHRKHDASTVQRSHPLKTGVPADPSVKR